MRFSLLLVLFCFGSAYAYTPEHKPDNAWSAMKKPTMGVSSAEGSYAYGCMLGGIELPASGAGFIDMRRNRNRYYGQPELIAFIADLGRFTEAQHGRTHLVGDLSQPRGGRMNFGHSSHQIGLDVDIWMQTVPRDASVSPYRDMQAIVNKARGVLSAGRLEAATRDALYFAAHDRRVARIFVNPVVKQHLCVTESNTAWLRKVRPWWGHDQHFHVRLSCGESSRRCVNQKPPPAGDGCDAPLRRWVAEQSDRVTGRIKPKKKTKAPSTKKKQRKKAPLPLSCQRLLRRADKP